MTGAYVKWLVNHLVQKDVLDAQIAVDKFSKEIKYLKGDMVSQGNWRATRALTDSTNNVADKALTTKKWLQGDSQGESDGDSPKNVEEGWIYHTGGVWCKIF